MRLSKRLLAIILCFALLLPLMGCDNPEQKEARYISRGNALFEKGELKKARIEYKNAIKLKPTDAEPYYRLGLVDEQEGNIRNAFGNFLAAEQQNSHFHPAKLKIAQYYLVANNNDETRKRIEETLSEDPENAEAHALYAALLLREKKYDEAEKEAKTALAKEPANTSAFAALTGIYSAQNALDKAEATINEGIKKNPKNLALMMLRVLLYGNMNDIKKIDEAYQPIFKLKPDEPKFRTDLAATYVKMNKLDEAEASLRKGIAEMPDNWEMKRQYMLFLSKYRSVDIAEKEIKTLMESNPDNDDLYFWLADLYVSHNSIDKAVALLDQVVERGDYDAPALNARTLLARINIKRGNKALAEKLVAAVLSKAPDDRSALLVRAHLSFESGNYQGAIDDLRAIVRSKPNDQDALQLLGETLLVQGHLDLAIDTMKKLVESSPTNFPARVRLAQMVHMNGDTKQARELISLVTKATPAYAVAWESMARLSIDSKDWLLAEEAVRTLDKLEGQHLTATFLEGQILDKNDKNEEALAKYTEVINADPKTPLAEHALRALVGTYKKLGRLEAAAKYLETLKVDSPLISTLIGKCYASIGKAGEAAAAYDKAVLAGASFADPYLDRANLFKEEQKMDQAIEVLKKGADAVPNDFRAPLVAATMLSQTGKVEEAIALYDQLLVRNPKLDVAANNLAELIADYQHNDSAALEKARQLAERFSGSTNPLLLDTLAWVYYRQGNIPMAQTIIERALQQTGKIPAQVRYHYGAILMKSGKTEKARAELQQAIGEGENYPGIEDAKKMLLSQ